MFMWANSSKPQPSSQSTGFASRFSGSFSQPSWLAQQGLDRRGGKGQGLRESPNEAIRAAAAEGIRAPATTLPYLDRIQASFGRHSIGHVKAHVGPDAAKAAREMNALAFASGDHVVFGGTPDLRTAAHEAAHIVQQQAGVQVTGGVGTAGDAYEREADAVADAVVAGRMTQGLLVPFAALPTRGRQDVSSSEGTGGAVIQCLGGKGVPISYENDKAKYVLAARKNQKPTPDYTVVGNWATIFYEPGGPITERNNTIEKKHAEEKCMEKGGNASIKWLFSERSPCGRCAGQLPDNFPHYFITEYENTDRESRNLNILLELIKAWPDGRNNLVDSAIKWNATPLPPDELLKLANRGQSDFANKTQNKKSLDLINLDQHENLQKEGKKTKLQKDTKSDTLKGNQEPLLLTKKSAQLNPEKISDDFNESRIKKLKQEPGKIIVKSESKTGYSDSKDRSTREENSSEEMSSSAKRKGESFADKLRRFYDNVGNQFEPIVEGMLEDHRNNDSRTGNIPTLTSVLNRVRKLIPEPTVQNIELFDLYGNDSIGLLKGLTLVAISQLYGK